MEGSGHHKYRYDADPATRTPRLRLLNLVSDTSSPQEYDQRYPRTGFLTSRRGAMPSRPLLPEDSGSRALYDHPLRPKGARRPTIAPPEENLDESRRVREKEAKHHGKRQALLEDSPVPSNTKISSRGLDKNLQQREALSALSQQTHRPYLPTSHYGGPIVHAPQQVDPHLTHQQFAEEFAFQQYPYDPSQFHQQFANMNISQDISSSHLQDLAKRNRGKQAVSSSLAGEKTKVPYWYKIDNDTQMRLMDVVSKWRGLLYIESMPTLQARLTPKLEKRLLSRILAQVHLSLNYLFPIESRTTHLPIWMNKMSPNECDNLVIRVSTASGYNWDVIRKYFLDLNMTPDMALELSKLSDEDLDMFSKDPNHFFRAYHLLKTDKEYARLHQLRLEDGGNPEKTIISRNYWDWELTNSERYSVLTMLMQSLGKNTNEVLDLLERDHIYPGFGQLLLQSDHLVFASLTSYLEYGQQSEE
jgi:hypothetical protein